MINHQEYLQNHCVENVDEVHQDKANNQEWSFRDPLQNHELWFLRSLFSHMLPLSTQLEVDQRNEANVEWA